MVDGNDGGKIIVIDNGSDMMKVGFGGGEVPDAVFSTVVGRLKHPDTVQCTD